MLMAKYRGVVLNYQPYSKPTSRRYDALGSGTVRVLDHNTFRQMKFRSGVPLKLGDVIFFEDVGGMAQNIVKEGKRRSRTLLYKS